MGGQQSERRRASAGDVCLRQGPGRVLVPGTDRLVQPLVLAAHRPDVVRRRRQVEQTAQPGVQGSHQVDEDRVAGRLGDGLVEVGVEVHHVAQPARL